MTQVPKTQPNPDKHEHYDIRVKQPNRLATIVAYVIVTLMVTALLLFILTGCLYMQVQAVNYGR